MEVFELGANCRCQVPIKLAGPRRDEIPSRTHMGTLHSASDTWLSFSCWERHMVRTHNPWTTLGFRMCLVLFVNLYTPGMSLLRWRVSPHTGHSLIQLLLFATVVNLDQTVNVKWVHYLGWPNAPKVPAGSIAFWARLWPQEGLHERRSKLWSPVNCLAGMCPSRKNFQSFLILGHSVDSLTGATFGWQISFY